MTDKFLASQLLIAVFGRQHGYPDIDGTVDTENLLRIMVSFFGIVEVDIPRYVLV